MAIYKDPWHSHLVSSVSQWSRHYIRLNDLGLSRQGFEHLTFCMQVEYSNQLRHRRGESVRSIWGDKIAEENMIKQDVLCSWNTNAFDNGEFQRSWYE